MEQTVQQLSAEVTYIDLWIEIFGCNPANFTHWVCHARKTLSC